MGQSQSETKTKLQETIDRIGAAAEAQIAVLTAQGKRFADEQVARDSEATKKFHEMIGAVGETSASSARAMNEQLLSALKDTEAYQKASNQTMSEFVRQLREAIGQSQSETDGKLREALDRVGAAAEAQIAALAVQGKRFADEQIVRDGEATKKFHEMIGTLGKWVDDMLGAMDENHEDSAKATTATIEKLSGIAESLMKEVKGVASGVQTAASAMRDATSTVVRDMNSGSEAIRLAASAFSNAGQSVVGALQEAKTLSEGLRGSADSIAKASADLSGVMADHERASGTFARMIEEMKRIVEIAKHEAGFTAELIARIEAASGGLGQAQKQAEEYLAEVTKILADTHERYNASLSHALVSQYKEFYGRFDQATSMLRSAIVDLSTTLQPPVRRAAE